MNSTNSHNRSTVARTINNKAAKFPIANCKVTTYFTQIEVKIGAYEDVKRPELNQNKRPFIHQKRSHFDQEITFS